jgi:hypothetical protein
MSELITGTVMQMFILAPPIAVCYIPFWDSLKFPKKKFWCITLISFVCFNALAAFFANLFYTTRWMDHILNIICFIFGFVLLYATVKAKPSKIFYVNFITGSLSLYLFAITGFFDAKMAPETFDSYSAISYIVCYAVLLVITMPFVTRFFLKRVKPFIKENNSSAWDFMWIIPASFYIIVSLYTGTYEIDLIGNPVFLVVILILSLSSFLIYDVVLRMVSYADKNAKVTQKMMMTEQQLELQGEQYKMLQTHITETKRVQHDLRHHLSVFKSHIDSGETGKLAEYVNEYRASLPDETEFAFCDNYAVNSILRYYIGIARNEGIQVETRLELPEKTGVSDSDLCIIFGNCIENAIEACRKTDGDRFIRINSRITGKMLVIIFVNSFNGVLKKEGNVFLLSKHNGEGVGISSVTAVARKYGEEAQFKVKENVFQASVMLRIKQDGK